MHLGFFETRKLEASVKNSDLNSVRALVIKNPKLLHYKGDNPKTKVFIGYLKSDKDFLDVVLALTGFVYIP